jgi:multicomponent Na+:H+ antiporter subunit E
VVLVVFPLPPLEFGGRLRPSGLVVLVGRFVGDLVVASVRVAALALFSRREIHGAVIEVPLQSRSDLNLLITAELISLVPGTLLADVRHRDRVLFLHVLDVRSPDDIERARRSAHAQEWRVLRALGSDAEIRAYEDSGLPTRVRPSGGAR